MLQDFYQNLDVVRVNTMPDRAYYLPCPPDRPTDQKQDNERVQLLNGNWDFHYFNRPSEFTFDVEEYDQIPVPGCWQMYGYDRHQYTNVRYPFPFNPPYVPKENPCGLYRRPFFIHKQEDRRYFITFEGVDSCHYLYINQNFVGYSQVSHSTAEYEVTDFVRDGENEIAVVVLKWCDGSYVEDQDKLRMTGIFRDVCLLTRPKEFIFDYKVKTIVSGENAIVLVMMDDQGARLRKRVELFDAAGEKLHDVETPGGSISFELHSPVLWSAEHPYLYTLKLTANGESIVDQVGVRTVSIENQVVLVNGRPVKLKGVNRHDSYADTGYVASIEQIIQDMRLMKEHNVNAIRTSHYPNRPEFPKLCDKYGFYVISESDIESHGTVTSATEWNGDDYALIADNPAFEKTIVDRVARNVSRDKNRPSVIFWSLGNESGFGCCFKAAIQRLRELDATRLVHYESMVVPEAQKATETFEGIDVFSTMYPSLEWVDDYFRREGETRPLVLCEFAHAMGNGPGGMEDYYQRIYQQDAFCGGFVWEWNDHVAPMGIIDGKMRYGYGGDFGEFPHDGNFCMDGLLYPDRRPHTGLLELKNAARPARIHKEEGSYFIENKLDFTNLKDALYLSWELKQDGELVAFGTMDAPDTPPHAMSRLELDLPQRYGELLFLTFTLHQKQASALVSAGYPLGFDQFDLSTMSHRHTFETEGPAISVSEERDHIILTGENFCYRFHTETGTFDYMEYEGKTLTEKPMGYNLFRAPTDNDRYIQAKWKEEGFDRTLPYTYEVTVAVTAEGVEIHCPLSIEVVYRQNPMEIQSVWTVFRNGEIRVKLDVQVRESLSSLPRFGLRMFLKPDFDRCEYFAYGPQESYIDKHAGSWKDRFQARVADMHEDYCKPQENGSHWAAEYVRMRSPWAQLEVTAEEPFSFNASVYTQEELAAKAHNFELVASGDTVLCLDCRMAGIGSNSCGPQLPEMYQVTDQAFSFTFHLTPSLLDEE